MNKYKYSSQQEDYTRLDIHGQTIAYMSVDELKKHFYRLQGCQKIWEQRILAGLWIQLNNLFPDKIIKYKTVKDL
jgi:hypothetical protein